MIYDRAWLGAAMALGLILFHLEPSNRAIFESEANTRMGHPEGGKSIACEIRAIEFLIYGFVLAKFQVHKKYELAPLALGNSPVLEEGAF